MTAVEQDRLPRPCLVKDRPQLASGLTLAVIAAASSSMNGPLAKQMLNDGWSPGAIVLTRASIAALVVAPLGYAALRGRWDLLRRNFGLVLIYGAFAVAGVQFFYLAAVEHMRVGPALLIQYTAPALVVLWAWWRHGQRPSQITLAGACLAGVGLCLVLGLFAGAEVNLVGGLWATAAMFSTAIYFVISADSRNGLPPLTLAAAGLLVGSLIFLVLAAVRVLPLRAASNDVVYAGTSVAWWMPLLVLGLVSTGLSYVTGVAGSRRLGSRLASFVALLEVVSAGILAWWLLDEVPRGLQVVGGFLVVAGVAAVKLGEGRGPRRDPAFLGSTAVDALLPSVSDDAESTDPSGH